MDMNFQTLKIEHTSCGIVILTLHRPEVMNAINSVMMEELSLFWNRMYADPANTRCIILTGSGDKAFCAGADLKERRDIDLGTWQKQHKHLQQAMLGMIDCPVPIIAAVNGVAFGGGLELTMASDFAYASATAKFAQSETKLGIMPGAMGTQNLPKAVGMRRAKELCFTAATFTAEQACQWGIVNQVCTPDELLPTVIAVAEKIAENAPVAIRQAKSSMNMSDHLDLKSGYFYEIAAYNYLLKTKDRIEGITAFNQKRQPVFSGE